jgi:rhomboid family GlyGly-CTERM serine protease
MPDSTHSLRRLPWLTLTVGASALLIHLWPGLATVLEYRRDALATGELHRLLGGHLAHWSATHLAYDLGAFLLLGIAVESRGRLRWAVTVGGTAVLSSLLLGWLRPEIAVYRGLSAIDSALFAAFATELVGSALRERRGPLAPRLAALGLPALLVAKMVYEAVTGTALFAEVGGVAVLPELHLVGALVGLGAAVSVGWPGRT